MELKLNRLYSEIERCISEMQAFYPERYQFLDEDTSFGNRDTKAISEAALKNYLELLQSEMINYRDLHEFGQP
jgi:hypothetical protein